MQSSSADVSPLISIAPVIQYELAYFQNKNLRTGSCKMPTQKKANQARSKSESRSKATAPANARLTKGRSPILQAVHETAEGLYSIGLLDKTTMREFDVLCLPKVPQYTPRQIKAIRTRCKASQAVFARCMNITCSSLQKWEIGAKKPSSVAMKLLSLVDTRGLEILI
jgi:putative transcriptional regulator